ncbi:hypothetical protein [Stenotrophomonas sp. GZD-301]|uniref:hypothetical protein n=1 Tax=Stenotrophomonas sp. GZD-301 TaxID=3404814 RepID=UPI003BB4B4E8
MRIILLTTAALLAACRSAPAPLNPPPPALIEMPVLVYVPIDADLRRRCQWEQEGMPSQVFSVSNGRKRCLQQYEAQLDGIDQVQGKPVPERIR